MAAVVVAGSADSTTSSAAKARGDPGLAWQPADTGATGPITARTLGLVRARMAVAIAAGLLSLMLLPGAIAAAHPIHAARAVTSTATAPTASDSQPTTPSPSDSTTPGKSSSTKRTGSGVIIGILILGAAVLLVRRMTGVRPARWRGPRPGQQPPPEE